ncbi:MAG: hypothetical protein IJU07_05775 [Synergistaceae bacterium]|nr:hypothetical protein [Synergistaceae bacterium]
MATSSIFHNVILRTPEQVEAFINAAEASERNPYIKPKGSPTYRLTTDTDEIRRLSELRRKNREQKQ